MESAFAERPDSLRQIRACKGCKLLKTASQFHASFCDNCTHEHPETLNAAARSEYVETRTTADYDGVCSLLQARGSWVATQLDMHTGDPERTPLKPGVYAISLPREEAYAAAEDADEEEAEEGDYEEDGDKDADEEVKGAPSPKGSAGRLADGGGDASGSASEGSGSSSGSGDEDEEDA